MPDDTCSCGHGEHDHGEFGKRGCWWHGNKGHECDGYRPKDTLPRGGAEGSEAEPMAKCQCGHIRGSHPMGPCEVCALRETDRCPGFWSAGEHVHEFGEWETRTGPWGLDLDYAYCPCGASKARRAELEKPKEPVCTHCKGPHALEDCKGLEEPEEGACAHEAWEERNPSSEGRVSRWCIACGHYMGRFDAEPATADIPRRPPYAVAYAVEGGAQYEVAVSGDATVVAEDGALHILHPKKPVLAIVRIQPMNMEENDA